MAFTLNNICRSWLSAHLNAFVDYLSPSNNLDVRVNNLIITFCSAKFEFVRILYIFYCIGEIYEASDRGSYAYLPAVLCGSHLLQFCRALDIGRCFLFRSDIYDGTTIHP